MNRLVTTSLLLLVCSTACIAQSPTIKDALSILNRAYQAQGMEEERKQLERILEESPDRETAAKKIIKYLTGLDPSMRSLAASFIWEKHLAVEGEIDTIVKIATTSRDADVRAWLAAALGTSRSKNPAILPALEKLAIDDKDDRTRAYAVTAIVRIKQDSKRTIGILIKALDDPSDVVRGEAIAGLAEFEAEAVAALPRLKEMQNDPSPYAADRARYAVYRISLPDDPKLATPILSEALADSFFMIPIWAAEKAGELGEDASDLAPTLIELTLNVTARDIEQKFTWENWNEQIALTAATALGRIGASPEILEGLMQGLDSPSILVRRNAAYALGNIGPDAAIASKKLAGMLDDSSYEVKFAASTALLKFGPAARDAFPELLLLLNRSNHSQLMTAIEMMGEFGNLGSDANHVVEILGDYIREHKDRSIQLSAALTLIPIAEHHPYLCAPHLCKLLNEKKTHSNLDKIIEALGVIGPPAKEAMPKLLEMLQDSGYSQQRHVIIIAIGRIHHDPETAVPILVTALGSANGSRQAAIAFALGMYGPDAKQALPALQELTKNARYELVKRHAREAMRRIDPTVSGFNQ